MSNFVKNELFDSVTESSLMLPNTIKIIDLKQNGGSNNDLNEYSATSSVLMSKMNNNYSDTSSVIQKEQKGGKNKQNGGENNQQSNVDINKLLSMLTSESNASDSTSTASLENKLVNMLDKKETKQTGGTNDFKIKYEDIKKYFHELKSNGVKVDIKLNDKSLSEFYNSAQNTTTDIINNLMDSQTSEFMPINQNENNINTTTSSSNFLMEGGDDDDELNFNLSGGKNKKVPSEAFLAFGKLKNYVADKLKIPASKIAMQIASAVLKDIKAKDNKISTIDAVNEAMKLFDKKKDHYYNLFKK
jgi:hypothetical protein